MNFDVAVNGRPWKVAIEATEQPNQVTVGVKGKKRVIDASWLDDDTLSLIDGAAAREVRISRRDDGVLSVAFGGRTFDVVVTGSRLQAPGARPQSEVQSPESAAPVARGFSPAAPVTVKAPMPGRVVRVLVAVGDRVSARQPLVVMEAMKMENELRSPKDGVVKEVNAQVGIAVDSGAVLVVVD